MKTKTSKPLAPMAARVGETIALQGHRLTRGTNPVAIAALLPMVIDAIVEQMHRNNIRGILQWVEREKATFLPDGTRVKVLSFSRTPRQRLSCARVEIVDGDLAGRVVWTPLNEGKARRYSDALLTTLARARMP